MGLIESLGIIIPGIDRAHKVGSQHQRILFEKKIPLARQNGSLLDADPVILSSGDIPHLVIPVENVLDGFAAVLSGQRPKECIQFTAQHIKPALCSFTNRRRGYFLDSKARVTQIAGCAIHIGHNLGMYRIPIGGFCDCYGNGFFCWPIIERHGHPPRISRIALRHNGSRQAHVSHFSADRTLNRH